MTVWMVGFYKICYLLQGLGVVWEQLSQEHFSLNELSWNWLKEKRIQDLEGERGAAAMFTPGRLVARQAPLWLTSRTLSQMRWLPLAVWGHVRPQFFQLLSDLILQLPHGKEHWFFCSYPRHQSRKHGSSRRRPPWVPARDRHKSPPTFTRFHFVLHLPQFMPFIPPASPSWPRPSTRHEGSVFT